MGLFDKIKEPIILKEDSSAKRELKELEAILPQLTDSKVRSSLEHDIMSVKAGIIGEDAILFELKNSHIPMYVIHDLYLEDEGLSAQIDFLVITRKRYFLIECKNLYGDITINNEGEFIRLFGNRREGIYSPITQGKRHLELVKQIRSAEKGNVLTRAMFEHNFYENYRSIVVLANPKTVLNAKYAKKEIREQVIRADQLIEYIRKVNAERDAASSSEAETEKLAQFFLSCNRPNSTDYTEKYKQLLQDKLEEPAESTATLKIDVAPCGSSVTLCPKCGAPMVKRRATKGENAGKEFWGCSKYPHCRGIIQI